MPAIRCTRPGCAGLIAVADDRLGKNVLCPSCGQVVTAVPPGTEADRPSPPPRLALEGYLDNVRSLWNVGSIFRTADAAGLRHLHLIGITGRPPRKEIRKTALGADEYVVWSHHPDPLVRAHELRAAGVHLYALESDADGPLHTEVTLPPPGAAVCLIVGNEVAGVSPALLELSDQRIRLPMRGAKRSLNVAVAFGIAVFELSRRITRRDGQA